jgi:hypothetical protein
MAMSSAGMTKLSEQASRSIQESDGKQTRIQVLSGDQSNRQNLLMLEPSMTWNTLAISILLTLSPTVWALTQVPRAW